MLWALHVIHTACTVHLEISPVHQGQIGCDQPGPENCMWLDQIWKKKSQDGCAEQVIFKHTCTVSSVFTSCSNLTIPWYNSIFFSYTYNKIMWYSSAKCKKKKKNISIYAIHANAMNWRTSHILLHLYVTECGFLGRQLGWYISDLLIFSFIFLC
jgi:hypothetical protein